MIRILSLLACVTSIVSTHVDVAAVTRDDSESPESIEVFVLEVYEGILDTHSQGAENSLTFDYQNTKLFYDKFDMYRYASYFAYEAPYAIRQCDGEYMALSCAVLIVIILFMRTHICSSQSALMAPEEVDVVDVEKAAEKESKAEKTEWKVYHV